VGDSVGRPEREILHERDGRIGYLTLNRPPLNILTIAIFEQMAGALDVMRASGDMDILVIRSAGDRAFSAGADVADHTPERAGRMLESFHRVARSLWSIDAVTLAAVRGPVLGGGMELALCCDLVVASTDAEFGQPEIHVGCFPPIAAAVLPQRIGRARAADLILTGRRITAQEALSMGLVSRLADEDRFEEEVREAIDTLTGNSGPVMRRAIKALRGAQQAELLERLAANERIYLEDLLMLGDAREGVAAFLEKREPRWRSRREETPGS
jgi:cyclohexa-1,5-dienecarbonyl-CoA hydratase